MSHKPAIVLSFDDGREDNYRAAFEILKPRNLSATFNITTGLVDGSLPEGESPCRNAGMSIDQVKEIYTDPLFEIGGHGDRHLNTYEDWMVGIDKLAEWLGPSWLKNGIGIASPHSEVKATDPLCEQDLFGDKHVRYIRLGLRNQRSVVQRGLSKVAAYTGNRSIYLQMRKSSIGSLQGEYCLYAVPVLRNHTVNQVEKLIQYSIRMARDCILMLHSVLKENEEYSDDLFSWPYDRFIQLCDYLKEETDSGKIRISKTIDAVMGRQ